MAERTKTLVLEYVTATEERVAAARWLTFWAYLNWALACLVSAGGAYIVANGRRGRPADDRIAAGVLVASVAAFVVWGILCWGCRGGVLRGAPRAARWARIMCIAALAWYWIWFSVYAIWVITELSRPESTFLFSVSELRRQYFLFSSLLLALLLLFTMAVVRTIRAIVHAEKTAPCVPGT